MKTFVQPGDVLTLTPGAAVPAGTGYLFGAGLFGVAVADVANGVPGAFIVEGVITMPKTSALAIATISSTSSAASAITGAPPAQRVMFAQSLTVT